MTKTHCIILLAAALCLPLAAAAQTNYKQNPAGKLYKWTDANGKVYYTDKIPTEASGRASEEMNRQGSVVRRNEAAMSAEQREQIERESKAKVEQEAAVKEEKRKNMALLNTYSSERDIEEARARALKANEDAVKDAEHRLAEAQKRQAALKGEAEFYQKKPMPSQLRRDVQVNEAEVKTQAELFEAKKKEVTNINAKYDEDKRRYLELTKGAPKTAQAAPEKK